MMPGSDFRLLLEGTDHLIEQKWCCANGNKKKFSGHKLSRSGPMYLSGWLSPPPMWFIDMADEAVFREKGVSRFIGWMYINNTPLGEGPEGDLLKQTSLPNVPPLTPPE